MHHVIRKLKTATQGSAYEGRLYLVGGIVRDKLLAKMGTVPERKRRGLSRFSPDEDIDIVLEGDAAELAEFLHASGVADHPPVTYPRFGTAMVSVDGCQVELVGARRESYDPTSRKPSTIPGTLLDDALRRDLTINTLLENLHTGKTLDLTGQALPDIENRVIRTPRDPILTFDDDPLRMLRAVRFATRLEFAIDPATYSAIQTRAARLAIISAERIQAEFAKILICANAPAGLEMLRETGLLDHFAPELAATCGVTQNVHHIHDVWTHTLKTLESMPADSGIIVRLAALLHDVGKPETRGVDEQGTAHFYRHELVGAEIARHFMRRLTFSNSVIARVTFLISMHLRVGEYDDNWSDAAVRRLLRDAGDHLDDLVLLTIADKAAANMAMEHVDIDAFRAHVRRVQDDLAGQRIRSPLTGREIIEVLALEPGPGIGAIKEYLESQIVEGNLLAGDKRGAVELLLRKYGQTSD
jgi:poly(A) polymerase